MAEYGIKETKEALVGIITLGSFVAKRLKDGADIEDARALGEKLLMDSEFRDKLQLAIDGMDQIDEEVGELSLGEGIELVSLLPDLLNILKEGSNG